jgi:hypothetical protein
MQPPRLPIQLNIEGVDDMVTNQGSPFPQQEQHDVAILLEQNCGNLLDEDSSSLSDYKEVELEDEDGSSATQSCTQ